jgi:glycosyltransferase involved in cell wall biosynthesis
MKVSISILGRFHFFDLAKQLEKKSHLKQLITSFPSFKVREWEVAQGRITSLFVIEVVRRLLSKTWFFNSKLNTKIKKVYGFVSSKLLKKNIDAFIFFAGNGFNSKIVMKLQLDNTICIADEGSAHILSQRKLLEDEYKMLGLEYITKQTQDLLEETLLEYKISDYITVPSSFVKRTFIEQGFDESNIFVNPYGVDLSQFKQIEKDDDVFRVIYCGRLSIQKGSHYLLEAIYGLNMDNFELWHVGGIDNEMKPYIEKFKSKKIVFKGAQRQEELYKFYSQGSVFILPSIQDGFGMVIFQAMACGLPVILSENTGAYDVITKDGEEGFVIPIRSVGAIQEKITYLYNNRNICKQMGERAKKKVSEGYTWDDYGDRYIDFLTNKIRKDKNDL